MVLIPFVLLVAFSILRVQLGRFLAGLLHPQIVTLMTLTLFVFAVPFPLPFPTAVAVTAAVAAANAAAASATAIRRPAAWIPLSTKQCQHSWVHVVLVEYMYRSGRYVCGLPCVHFN